jgi:predicted O-linked N-acetylglucosamine transferase (SPINDLY family)
LTERFPARGLGWKVLGALLWADGNTTDSVAAMQRSAQLLPEDAETLNNLAAALVKLQRFDEAEACLGRVLEIDPESATAFNHFSNLYQMQGRYVEAEASVRRAVALLSDDATDDKIIYSSLLFMLSHNPAIDADTLYAEHCRVGALLETRLRASWPRHSNSRVPDRRLQVGLVSGDLCNHAVAHFVEPVLAHLRLHEGIELRVYYTNTVEDEVTARLRAYVPHWSSVAGIPNEELAKRVMEDRIDILIDVSGHTSLNRLSCFAAKPAPVQVSWLGYVGTTGLLAMDYYMTDRHFLPAAEFARYFTEKLVYLPAAAPFLPHESGPPVNALPASTTGRFTFGSFNRLGKINAATIALWSQLLLAVPDARLMVGAILPGTLRENLIHDFGVQGIARERLTFHERCPMNEFLALHHSVDVCLDTQPWAGGTTTNHALWMGVPTLTLTGTTPASRLSAALLEQVDLGVFVAASGEDFIARGVYWTQHLTELAGIRATLRDRCLQSSVRQPAAVACSIDGALRHMWKRWCAGLPPQSFEIGTA